MTQLRAPFRKSTVAIFSLWAVFLVELAGCIDQDEGVEIRSYILRDRIIVTDKLIRKKALYLSFSRTHAFSQRCAVRAQLIHQGQLISQSSLQTFKGITGSLFFDLPAEIPNGSYTIAVQLMDDNNKTLARISKTVDKKEFNRIFQKKSHGPKTHALPRKINPEIKNLPAQTFDHNQARKGYIVFQKSPLEYVYSDTRPESDDIVTQISLNVVKNEYVSIPISIYALQDLGTVNLKIDGVDKDTLRLNENITINHIESVDNQMGLSKGTYTIIPELIVPGSSIRINKGDTERFWLTLHIPSDTAAGTRMASIVISPEKGPQIHLPLRIKVNDITLEDVPGVHYFMLMTYEFTELVHNWSGKDKKRIYNHACQILKDYKAHGMTALCPHSPFIPIEDSHGGINLSDIKAALIAARDVGLKGPVIWYMGHLIQTAKPKHPGSILGFEPHRSYDVLEKLVREMDQFARDNHCPQIVFLPIDEPDDEYQDFRGERFNFTIPLLQRIKSYGGMTAVTAVSYNTFQPKDFLLTTRFSDKDLQKARKEGCAYIEYNNKVTTRCTNPAYARYIYGYYTWQRGLNGMCSWTFQNTQNASGDPRIADTAHGDIYLAYPDPDGPLASLTWEAVREGIEDYKLLYQLEKRMKVLVSNGHSIIKYNDLLCDIREKATAPDCVETNHQEWNPEDFAQTKGDIIRMILETETLLGKSPKPSNAP